MASALCKVASRSLPRLVRKPAPVASVRLYSDKPADLKSVDDLHEGKVVEQGRVYANELGHSVAKERFELKGIRKGVDIWDDLPHSLKEGEGTFSNPKMVYGLWDYRLVACVCDDHMDDILYTVLENNTTDQCKCGYWWTYKKIEDPELMSS